MMKHTEVFMGRVGQLKDIRELANKNCVVNFSVAETVRVKKGDNWEDGATVWTNVTIFGDEARNFHRSVKPGTQVIVIGTRSASEYTPADSNEKRTNQSVIAEQVGIAITKFDYVDTIGNVNYAKGESGSTKDTGSTSKKENTKTAAKEEDPFSGNAMGAFGDDDDPFGLNG